MFYCITVLACLSFMLVVVSSMKWKEIEREGDRVLGFIFTIVNLLLKIFVHEHYCVFCCKKKWEDCTV